MNPTKMTGGELPQPNPLERDTLAALISAEEDVLLIRELQKLPGENRYLYLIETPFDTFPKFVVGTTDPANEAPEILCKSGALWAANDEFDRILTEIATETEAAS